MFWLITVAVLGGVLGGMGMGGGTVYIPALTLLFGMGQHLAQWLNLISFVPMAVVSVCIHAKNKRLDKGGLLLLLAGLPAAVGCAYLAGHVRGKWLALGFALLLVSLGVLGTISSVRNAIRTARQNKAKEPEDE